MIISRTPFRISFFGGGTDFPGYYHQHGGEVLCSTIDKYSYLLVHSLGPFFSHRFRANYSKTEDAVEPSELNHPLIRECLLHLEIEQGLEVAHVADLPGRTGLGSSSSFTVGLLNALHTFRNEEVSPAELARQAIHIERDRVGDPGGHQDQYAAAYGGFSHLRFERDGTVHAQPLALPQARLEALQDRLEIYYTGTDHSAGHISIEQTDKIGVNTSLLHEMKAMVPRAIEILEGDGDLDAFGELLHETWERKKQLAQGITNSLVDDAYRTARETGALGGKLLGAGGRGFLLFYVPSEKQADLETALGDLKMVDFHFSANGSEIILAEAE